MPILQLNSIQCRRTEDWTGPDAPYLLVGARQVWGSESMNDSETEPLTQVPGVPFKTGLKLSLYDQDMGWFDEDDLLGSWVVWAGEVEQGEKEARFNGDGADYSIYYVVSHDRVPARDDPVSPQFVVPLAVIQALGAVASVVSAIDSVISNGQINARLKAALQSLASLHRELADAVNNILAAISAVAHQIDEDLALNCMSDADVAINSDLLVLHDLGAAMSRSYSAANRLARESDVAFAAAFIYAVNIRMAVMKAYSNGFANDPVLRVEAAAYRDKLNSWLADLNQSIRASHSTSVVWVEPDPPHFLGNFWSATHSSPGKSQSFRGPYQDHSDAARQQVLGRAAAAMAAGVTSDRQSLGVVAMEQILHDWAAMFP